MSKILVVDDSYAELQVIEGVLKGANHTVVSFPNTEKLEDKVVGEKPDLIVMRRDPTLTGTVRQRFAAAMKGLKQLEQTSTVVETAAKAAPVQAAPQEPTVVEANHPAEADQTKAKESTTGEDREVIRVSRERLERLLNLVGELVIGRGRLEQRLSVLEQLSQQVLACKVRLTDSVRSFEEKHTFTLPTSTGGTADHAGQERV